MLIMLINLLSADGQQHADKTYLQVFIHGGENVFVLLTSFMSLAVNTNAVMRCAIARSDIKG